VERRLVLTLKRRGRGREKRKEKREKRKEKREKRKEKKEKRKKGSWNLIYNKD